MLNYFQLLYNYVSIILNNFTLHYLWLFSNFFGYFWLFHPRLCLAILSQFNICLLVVILLRLLVLILLVAINAY